MNASISPPGSSAGARSRKKASAALPTREPRGAKRKRETHDKLLRAAFELIAARGVDGVAINEITEAADVGFGSFYNHFPSKEAIYEEVFQAVFEAYGAALDRLTEPLEDPALVIAVCVRHTIARAQREPLWGRFLIRESFAAKAMTRGLGARLLRDIQAGIAQGRFTVPDPLMAALLAGGTVIATVAAQAAAVAATREGLAHAPLDSSKLGERAAVILLSSLGLRRAEAVRLAERPLPPLEWPPLFARSEA